MPNNQTVEVITEVLYTRAEANGVITLIVASSISCAAVVGLIAAISLSAFHTRKSTDGTLFVRNRVAVYFISLLFCDIIQAVGSIMSIRWVKDMHVVADHYCTAQGAIKQFADVSSAIWTLIIASHTFLVLFLRIELKPIARWATLIGGWSAICAVVISGPATLNDGPYYGISGYWCWIGVHYEAQRFILDYTVMFVAALFSFILYTLVYLRLRGNILVHGWRISFRLINDKTRSTWRGRELSDTQTLRISRHMLLYPVAYTIIILPIAIARFSDNVPFEVTLFCDTIYLFSGTINVILFATTRRILPPKSVLGSLKISRPHLIQSTAALAPDGSDPYYYPQGNVQTGSAAARSDMVDVNSEAEKGRASMESRESEYSKDKEQDVGEFVAAPMFQTVKSPDADDDLSSSYSEDEKRASFGFSEPEEESVFDNVSLKSPGIKRP